MKLFQNKTLNRVLSISFLINLFLLAILIAFRLFDYHLIHSEFQTFLIVTMLVFLLYQIFRVSSNLEHFKMLIRPFGILMALIIVIVSSGMAFLTNLAEEKAFVYQSPINEHKVVVFITSGAYCYAYPVRCFIFYKQQENARIIVGDFYGEPNVQINWQENTATVYRSTIKQEQPSDSILVNF